MQHPTRTAFGQILGHPTHPNIRFFFPPDGDGTGGGSGGSAGSGSDGGQGGASGGQGEQGVDAATAKALRDQADRRMTERNDARDALKPWTELGITLEEAKQLKADRDQKNGGPTPEQIQKQAERDAEKAAGEKFAGIARTSAVKTQAALLGFHNPVAALAMLDPAELAKVTVDDQYQADDAAVKALLENLATAEPYLMKQAEQQTADWRTAGIGGTGGSAKPEFANPTQRMKHAYADSAAAASRARSR